MALRKKILFIFYFLVFTIYCSAQNLILNGSFENTLCNTNATAQFTYGNLSTHQYDSLVLNSYSFGTDPNLDMFNNNMTEFCVGGAVDGNWFVCLTSGGTDALSLKLSSPIIKNNIYTVIFYTRSTGFPPCPVKIGISNIDTLFGDTIFISSIPTDTCIWNQNIFSFIALDSAKYITVTCGGASNITSQWIQVDNFVLDTGNTTSIKKVIENNLPVTIYPNPAKDKIYIESKGNIEVKVFNILGNEILTTKQKEIDISNLSEGVYYVQVNTNRNISTQKIIVQH